jgi:hypothetical protein
MTPFIAIEDAVIAAFAHGDLLKLLRVAVWALIFL